MSARRRGHLLGGATVALGSWWLASVLLPQVPHFLGSERSLAVKAFMLPVLLTILAPGTLLVGLGIQLCREATIPRVKWALGSFLALAVLMAAPSMNRLFEPSLPNRAVYGASLFAATIIASLLHGPLARGTLAFLRIPLPPQFHVVGRGLLFLLSIELWFLLAALLRYEPSSHSESQWRLYAGFLVPILASVAFYRISVFLLGRSRKRLPVTHDP